MLMDMQLVAATLTADKALHQSMQTILAKDLAMYFQMDLVDLSTVMVSLLMPMDH